MATIAVSDDALGTNALTLSGADAASFEIVGSELRLKAGTSLDFETQGSYDVTVTGPAGFVATTVTEYTVDLVPKVKLEIVGHEVELDRAILEDLRGTKIEAFEEAGFNAKGAGALHVFPAAMRLTRSIAGM